MALLLSSMEDMIIVDNILDVLINIMLLLLMMSTQTSPRAPEGREHSRRAPPGPRKVLLDAYWGGQQMAVASLEDATAPGRPKTSQEVRNLRGPILALPQPWRNVVSNDPD